MSKLVRIGDVNIGNGNPIAIQSMTNCDSRDEKALLEQIARLKDCGCDIIRIAIPDMDAVETFRAVKKKVGNSVPLVTDIHFDYRLAIESIKAGADKIRINPGNIGSIDRVKAVVDCAKERNIPIRVGVNSGSLEKDILEKFGHVNAEGLAMSALRNLKVIEDMSYDNLVVSLKSSNVKMNYEAHKLIAKETDHPIHIGVTEAGTLRMGEIKSAAGIGALLLEGIGDTLRVSLTADPTLEVIFAKDLLKAVGITKTGIDIVSCPTCGRTKIDLVSLANEVETRVKPLEKKIVDLGLEPIKLAVMGCAVNGPGEAREADFGVAGGVGEGLLFKKGEILRKVKEEEIVTELLKLVEEYIAKGRK